MQTGYTGPPACGGNKAQEPSDASAVVQSQSHVWLFAAPWTAARQASLSITNSQSLLKLTSTESVMPSNHLSLCHPLLLLPSIFPSIRVFSNESVLHIRWPKYWSFSCSSVLPMNTQGWAPVGLTGDRGDAPSYPCTRTPRDCSLKHHWALLCPIYFYAISSLVKKGHVLPFPPFPNWKRKGTNKPEFNLFWQLSQSSYSEGGPAHRRGMTLSHPGSRQRRPCFSPSVFSHVETYWPRCLPIHILMGKRERRTQFFF